jgi:redox-sensitive bicupin YhaK (pirin superfamily)
MSGPVDRLDRERHDELLAGIQPREGRRTEVAGLPVTRVLPTKGRRTVGAWCFVDLMGPVDAEEPDPMEVGPHPHTGLWTVTWLLEGEALHSDSLGTEQVIRPGQLNLMTAGAGIAHAELAAQPPFRGAQLWIAQPEATRHGAGAFAHHAELPQVRIGTVSARMLVGDLAGVASPARADSPLVGAQLELGRERTSLPVQRTFEHALVPLDGRLRVGDEVVEPGWLALVPAGVDELPIEADRDDGRALLLGGEPLGEQVQMWWNFVGRSRDELEDAWRAWRDRTDRFGDVPSKLARIEAPVPPWVTARGDGAPR